ncbi:MAG TPA: ribulokinase [Aestuariivirga sp.]
MAIVIGVDFGTLSVRASVVDSKLGMLATYAAEYPLKRLHEDPNFATQSHRDHMASLAIAVKTAVLEAGVDGLTIESIALDTTGSSVVVVDANMQPLGDYYLWCDHRAKSEAAEITRAAHKFGLEAIKWCGGTYSSEWGFAKLLHWLRHNPELRASMASAFEHCDMVAATLCGVKHPQDAARSICAMGHKWLWNASLGGLPPQEFLVSVDPLLAGVREKLSGNYQTSDKLAGSLSPEWAEMLGLKAGIPIPVGAFDAHWDAIGTGARTGDMVNVIGTSTCIIGISKSTELVPGLCGVVPGSVHPSYLGVEAGLSAVGDIFAAIANRANSKLADLLVGLENYKAGQTGLLRLVWDNGDRTILVNPFLTGVTLGWTLSTTVQDELMAAIEGTAFNTRIIFGQLSKYGVAVTRVINAGGIGQRNEMLNQLYANVLGRPVVAPAASTVGLGAAIFAFLAAKTFSTVEEAQNAVCPPFRKYLPDAHEHEIYTRIYEQFRAVYFGFGDRLAGGMKEVLPELIAIREQVTEAPDLR